MHLKSSIRRSTSRPPLTRETIGARTEVDKICDGTLKLRAVLKFNFLPCRLWPDVGDGEKCGCWHRRGAGGSPPQSPAPGFGEKYCSLSGFPSHSLESAGGAFLVVIFGQIFAYFAFSDSHSTSLGSVSGFMASTGHSGTQTPQSIHSSGWITSMFSPS